MSTQIEVKEPIKLLNKDGSLTQPGWAKRNIIEYNREDIRASKWAVKEWDFYQVGCKDFIVQFNFFNISLASAATIGYVNLKTGEVVNDMILDLATANKFPVNRNGEEPYTFERKKGKKVLRFEVTKEKRHLYWKSPKIECDFWADNYTGESIVIMNPFEKHANHFFFTEKINCMPTRGFVKIGSEVIDGNRDDLFTSESSVYNHIVGNVAPPHVEFKAVLPTGWETINLVNVLDPNNGAKSDNDDLTDWEEVDTESGLITWDNDGNIQLPTFEQCLNKVHDQGFSYVLNEYSDSIPSYMHRYFYGVEILPIKSNPCEEDSDGDGLNDGYDPNSLSANNYSSQMIALDNTETVTIIQKCLEYLGYLDMQNQAYGTFGGLSIAATQLFQLNHRTFSDGISFKKDSNDSYFIDLNTYYAILLEAKNNGFTDLVEDIVWFNENYTPKTMPLEEFNASLNPNNPVFISSVKRSDFDKDNVYNDKVDIYVYDYTPILNGILRYGAQEFHFHYYSCNPSPVESLNYPCQKYDNTSNKCARLTGDYSWMISQVKNNAPYDVKTSGSWNNFMKTVNANIRFSTSSFPFLYSDIIINAEIFGNILFGYAGHAGGFTKKELESGGSLYSFVTTGEFDNTEDSTYVRYGYDLYNNVIKDYDYIHISQ